MIPHNKQQALVAVRKLYDPFRCVDSFTIYIAKCKHCGQPNHSTTKFKMFYICGKCGHKNSIP